MNSRLVMQKQFRTIDPNRIRVAREVAGLSKAQLAAGLGVEPRTITTYESDGAPARQAESLSVVTGRPVSFFNDNPFDLIEPERVQFRSAKKVAKKKKAESTSFGALGLLFYSKLVAAYSLPMLDVPTLDNIGPREAAERLRVLWGLGDDPLPNLIQLFESKGIRVLSLPRSIEELDAFSYWYTDGFPYIFLNIDKTAERVRFDLAHELGHLILHTREVSSDRDVEKEADSFAAEFLMPARGIRADMRPYSSIPEIIALKSKYRVSAMAMNYRGGELGILKEWGQRQNYIELNRLGYKKGEPNGLKLDRSRVLPFVLADARKKGVKIADIAREVGINMSEVNGFTFGEVLAPVQDSAAEAGFYEQDDDTLRTTQRPNLRIVK